MSPPASPPGRAKSVHQLGTTTNMSYDQQYYPPSTSEMNGMPMYDYNDQQQWMHYDDGMYHQQQPAPMMHHEHHHELHHDPHHEMHNIQHHQQVGFENMMPPPPPMPHDGYLWDGTYLPPQHHQHHQMDPMGRYTPPADGMMAPMHQTPAMPAMNPVGSVMYTPESDASSVMFEEPMLQEPEVPVNTEFDHVVMDTVDGRLPVVGDRAKYELTVAELRRRTGAPEYMNYSALYCFFRKSKKKNGGNEVKALLDRYGLHVKLLQRQKRLNSFSPFLEEETVHLAKDIETLYEKYYPMELMAGKLITNMFENGRNLDQCVEMFSNTVTIIRKIVATLAVRQPKVTGRQEKLKGNSLDLPYLNFSLLTHGFGHPSSLTHYNLYQKIFETAIVMCQKMQQGMQVLQQPIPVHPDQNPFKYMSEHNFRKWKANEQYMSQVPRTTFEPMPLPPVPPHHNEYMHYPEYHHPEYMYN